MSFVEGRFPLCGPGTEGILALNVAQAVALNVAQAMALSVVQRVVLGEWSSRNETESKQLASRSGIERFRP